MEKATEVLSPEQFELKSNPPTILIELVDQGSSGFFQDDTIGTTTPIELRAPGIRFLPNEGYRRGVKTEIVNGKEVNTYYNEKIRYIKNETVISVAEQRRLGIEPNPLSREDKIAIEKGYATVVREGSTIGLYDFFIEAYFNEGNPHRSPKANALWRILELDKQAEKFNEDELVSADAVKYVGSLYQKTGKNQYTYFEDKIDAVCDLMAVHADTYATRIKALLMLAKQRPKWFLNLASKLDQVVITEVLQAYKLNVIRFEENAVIFTDKKKVVKSFASGKPLDVEQMVSLFAEFLRTKDGHTSYMELKAELDAKQNNLLNN